MGAVDGATGGGWFRFYAIPFWPRFVFCRRRCCLPPIVAASHAASRAACLSCCSPHRIASPHIATTLHSAATSMARACVRVGRPPSAYGLISRHPASSPLPVGGAVGGAVVLLAVLGCRPSSRPGCRSTPVRLPPSLTYRQPPLWSICLFFPDLPEDRLRYSSMLLK